MVVSTTTDYIVGQEIIVNPFWDFSEKKINAILTTP
jgi:hypothetical protein